MTIYIHAEGSREQLDRLVVRVFDMLHDSSREVCRLYVSIPIF